jgi:hypothetical protein
MLLFILWRDTTSELWTPVQFPLHCYYYLLLLALFTFLHTAIAFHSICSILCLQQTGEIDNLIVSLGAKFLVVLYAGSMLLLVQSKALDEAPYKLFGAVAKLAGITF